MMSMKKAVASNKMCAFLIAAAMGAAIGMVAGKVVIDRCSCCNDLKSKAKRALKTMEEKLDCC